MYRIIGGDGREYGPVSAAQVEQWIAQKRANGGTQIKAEGAAVWSSLAALPEFAAAFTARVTPPPLPDLPSPEPVVDAAAPASPVAPTDESSPSDSTTAASTPPRRDPAEAARACVGRDYRLSVFDTLSRGWDIMAGKFLLTVCGTTAVVLISVFVSAIPYVGAAASLLLPLVFIAGVYSMMLRVSRGESAGFPDAFAGFGRAFKSLIVLSVAATFVLRLFALIGLGPLLWQLHRNGFLANSDLLQIALGGDPFSELFSLFLLKGAHPDFASLAGPIAAMPLLLIPFLYLSVSWIFAPMLVIDRGLGPFEALELSRKVAGRHWFRLFFLNLAFLPLFFAGALCFIVGIFVVLALNLASFVAAYETAYADKPDNSAAGNRPFDTPSRRD